MRLLSDFFICTQNKAKIDFFFSALNPQSTLSILLHLSIETLPLNYALHMCLSRWHEHIFKVLIVVNNQQHYNTFICVPNMKYYYF